MRIESYRFGSITVDGKTYTSDVLIWPEGVDDSWWREAGHSLCPEDLERILDKHPDVLVIGTGAYGLMKVPQATVDFLRQRCQEVHIAKTGKACEQFNELSPGDRRVAAALHLTC